MSEVEPELAFRPLFFNAGQLEPEQIEAQFIARQEVFKNLLDDILGERQDSAPQHHLVIGQRGMGKTTLLHRIAVELNKEPHCETFIPLTFPEEQHVLVGSLADFWLNVLDALATALESRGRRDLARALDRTIAQLPAEHNDEGDLAAAARKHWLDQCGELGLRPVLLLDNFPLLLEKLKSHQWELRAFLQEAGAPIFVTAGVALPESLGDYDAAFFDMFKARVLYTLTLSDCREIYNTMARREGNQSVVRMIAQNESRLKTLYIITGGNPRTVGLLYELFARGLGKDAWEDLRALLDTVTPLYQSRLEQLSDKAQQIFAALALTWEPALQNRIAQHTKLPQGTLSSTLLRMEEAGVVEKVDIFGEKKTGWQIAERFFNIWFLMRFASRRTLGSIAALASFLELFYSADELHGAELTDKVMDDESAGAGVSELHQSLVALRRENLGDAKRYLRGAFKKLDGEFRDHTVEDWYRACAAWLDLGKGEAWLCVSEDVGASKALLPFHEAVDAHHRGDIRFLNNIPKEAQSTAEEIYEKIEQRRRKVD